MIKKRNKKHVRSIDTSINFIFSTILARIDPSDQQISSVSR